MAVKKRKPTSAGRRFQTVSDFVEITTDTPEKSLISKKAKTGGRNTYGRVTSRHRGGGHKRLYRIIDFRRDKDGIPARVATIEYDPNRNARIALLHYADGEKRYILAPVGVKVDDRLESGSEGRHPSRECPASTQHPGRHLGPRHRDAPWWRRQARPLRRALGAAHVEGKRPRPAPAPLGGDAPGAARLPGDRRPGGQHRGRAGQAGQGGPQPLEGCPPPDQGCRHEPGRPPAGRWRGQVLRVAGTRSALGASRRAGPGARRRRATQYIVRRRAKKGRR